MVPASKRALFKQASIRPHFDIPLTGVASDVLATVGEELESEDAPFIGGVLATHGYLRIRRDERSLLSPNLNLDILDEDGRQTLRGRFTPHPSVWMGFVAVFLVLGMIGLGGLMYGFAQLTLTEKETPWAMLAAPVCAGLIAFVYGAAFVAQGLVQDEMYAMRAWVESLAKTVDGTSAGSDVT